METKTVCCQSVVRTLACWPTNSWCGVSFRMKVKAGFTAFLLLLLTDLPLILGRKCGGEMCKVNENSAIPVDLPRLCGDNIMKVYTKICDGSLWAKRRRRRGGHDMGWLDFMNFFVCIKKSR